MTYNTYVCRHLIFAAKELDWILIESMHPCKETELNEETRNAIQNAVYKIENEVARSYQRYALDNVREVKKEKKDE
mgnify:CR=1 FL=1